MEYTALILTYRHGELTIGIYPVYVVFPPA